MCGWKILHNKLSTRDRLFKVRIPIESCVCVFCDSSAESMSHWFFMCFVAIQMWKMCDNWFGVNYVHHNFGKRTLF